MHAYSQISLKNKYLKFNIKKGKKAVSNHQFKLGPAVHSWGGSSAKTQENLKERGGAQQQQLVEVEPGKGRRPLVEAASSAARGRDCMTTRFSWDKSPPEGSTDTHLVVQSTERKVVVVGASDWLIALGLSEGSEARAVRPHLPA